ncbi:MAG: hypothetical protein A2W91_02640 [Bacteroidetes bacterium GWF2_38_335]|nr:MAG: hypothetical protein A2W91_02640 [Bacteroidetes bacterium GWF2_38_335]OFY77607.1 MAG: hypothetical protein A2281_02120 [Bacteroidetes bacterium RIFOXYA12_FULL_38_20]HBS87090.1 hypothetical protein [Bacteroidales bacterium]
MIKKMLLVVLVIVVNETHAQSPVRLGLNFPFRNPELTSIDNYMSHIQESGAQIYRQMTYADLLWRQVEPTNNNWQFGYADSIFLNYTDFEFVGNLFCFSIASSDTNNVGYQVPWRACDGLPVCGWNYDLDSSDTKDYLSTCISRYSNIHYWELGNESENSSYPLGIPNMDFIDFTRYNYNWIKELDSQAKVLLPGTLGTYDVPFTSKYNWYHTVFANDIGNYFDIFSFHDYNAWWTTPVHIDSIIAIRDNYGLQPKEIWITESSVSSLYDSISPNYVSIDEQAADVWRRTTIAWAKGINTFIWHGCWSSGMPSEWAEFGLLDHTGKKKKSFHSFKLLSEKIISFDSAQVVSQGIAVDDNNSETGGNGVWVMKFIVNDENKYVMWSRDNQSFQLTPSSNATYKITSVVPYFISLDGETVSFEIDSVDVASGNSHVFNLSSLPILVEETNADPINEISEKIFVKVFPNPANESIEIVNLLSFQTEFIILDINGKVFYKILLDPLENKSLPVDGASKGTYIYKILNNRTIIQEGKLIIN